MSALGCLWIWSSEVVRPGHSFLGMCHPVWGCSCGCFPIPVSPQGQERVGSARNVGVSTQEWLCRDMHGQNPWKCFASVGTVEAQPLFHSDPSSLCPCGVTPDPHVRDPSLSFPAPSFAGCVTSGRASAWLLPANPVEETSLGIGVLGKVRLQLEEKSCSRLDWDYLPARSMKTLCHCTLGFQAPSWGDAGAVPAPIALCRALTLVFRVKRAKAFKNNTAKWNFPTDPRSKRGALGPAGLSVIAVNKENIFLPFLGGWELWAPAPPAGLGLLVLSEGC